MLEKIAKFLTKTQTTKPSLYLIATLIVTLAILPGMGFLIGNIEPSLEKVLPQDVEEVMLMNQMRAQYGADMMYVVLEGDFDARSYESLRYMDIVGEKLLEVDNVLDITSISTIILDYNEFLPIDIDQSKAILKIDPRTETMLNYDSSVAVIQVRTDTGASAARIKQVVDDSKFAIESLEDYNPGFKYSITGFGAIDKATFNVIITDFAKITLISFALVAFFVFLSFRTVKKTMLALSVVMITLIWTLGITGYLQLTITVVTMVAAAMIMGLGISYGIHVVHRYYELRKNNKAKQAIGKLQEELIRALLGSSMTTSAGFLALLFGVLPAMKNLGIILGIGILLTFIVAIGVLPVLIFKSDKEDKKKLKNDI
ncbi:hypothetical protein C0585_08165 [Candidatus Woesearchaeota archaeon]|mgnify:CR=1 FL=1|nr:MAG: hypothetical protein C0585_08165 [Candidatus Woesearchaeota archaeon]